VEEGRFTRVPDRTKVAIIHTATLRGPTCCSLGLPNGVVMPSGSGSPSSAQSALDLFASEVSSESPATVVLPPPSAASVAAWSVQGLPEVLPVTEILTARSLPGLPEPPVHIVAEPPRPSSAPEPAAPPSAASSAAPLSIVALCASRVELDRNEAVSIVQGLCRAILDGQHPPLGAPLELGDVFLDQYGTISLRSRPDPQVALPAVKHLLHALLPPNEFLVAKALPDSTLEEFSRGLAHFMPADSLEAGQKVYLRWRTRPLRTEVLPPPEPIQAPPEPEETRYALWRRRLEALWRQLIEGLRSRRWHVEPLLVVAAILGMTSAALFAWGFKSYRAEPTPVADAAPVPAPAVAPDTVEPVGPPPPVDRAATDVSRKRAASAGAGSVSRVSRTDARPPAATSAPADSQRQADATPLTTVPFTGASSLAGASVTTLSKVDTASRPAPAPRQDAVADAVPANFVFDSGQSDVIPPEFVYPLLSVPLPIAGALKGQPSIEVTINEQGTIDGVKASIPPTSIAQAVKMLGELSAAKAWRFRPASRNGHPVKYRLVVPLSLL